MAGIYYARLITIYTRHVIFQAFITLLLQTPFPLDLSPDSLWHCTYMYSVIDVSATMCIHRWHQCTQSSMDNLLLLVKSLLYFLAKVGGL